MPATVTVLLGPARSGKTHELLRRYHETLRQPPNNGGIGRALWLAPNSRAATDIRQRLLGAGTIACLEPGVTTFDALANDILAASTVPPRSLPPALERALLRRVVRDALANGKLKVLAEAAARNSFLQLLDAHFDELERRGIRPEKYRQIGGVRGALPGDLAQHAELAFLYAEYSRLLAAHNLADRETRLAAACEFLATEKPQLLFANLQLAVVDGFTDFSAVQLELLQQLAKRTPNLIIALPGDGSSLLPLPPGEGRGEGASIAARADLFAKSNATLADLKRHHARLQIERLSSRPGNWPAMDHIQQNLFRHPRDVAAPSAAAVDSLRQVEIIEAAGSQDEIVQLARAIKRRLLAGEEKPGDIVVVFRQLHDAAPRVRSVFAEFGIPFSLESGLPLIATGAMRALLDLLRLDADDWPFRRVVNVITNNLLTSIARHPRAATEWLVRDLQVAKHRDTLLTRIDRLAGEVASATGSERPSHHDRQIHAANAALPILQHVAASLTALPDSATPTEWIAALTQLGRQLGIEALGSSATTDPLVAESRLAWQHVADHFAALERLSIWLAEPTLQLSRRDLLAELIDVATNEKLPRPHDDVGRVRVLSAATARTVTARHLILAGMSEQAFPAPERAGRLYSDADYTAFARAADQELAEQDASDVRRPQEEMLLFYEVVTRATDRLTISYPAIDEKAQPLPPSPYLTELARTFKDHPLPRRGAPRPSPLPPNETPLCPSDWRIGAIDRAVLHNPPELALLARLFTEPSMRPVANSLDAALRIIADRGNWNTFSPAEGLLTSDAVRKRLARRFGKDHLWSPSQFETYSRCSFDFLMEDILSLEPLGELVLETDPLRRGMLMHQALADFHREHAELFTSIQRSAAAEVDQFVTEFTNVVEALTRASPHHGVEAALAELDRRRIVKWAPQYYEQHTGYRGAKWPQLDEPLAPAHFEWRFGPPRSEETEHEDPHSTAEPYLFDLGGEKIRVTGRVDRIDVGRRGEKTVFNVIDYKSGKRPSLAADKMATGERLQPALYVMAAQALLFGNDKSTPLWAGYWSMNEGPTTDARFSLQCSVDGVESTESWQTLQKTITDRVREIVSDIRGGQFPVFSRDDHCTSYCDFRTVCRIAQVRSLQKQPTPEI